MLNYFWLSILFTAFGCSMCDSSLSTVQDSKCDSLLEPYNSFCYNTPIEQECQSNSTECFTWCENKVEWKVEDSQKGTVKFKLWLAPQMCCFNRYHIILRTSETKDCNFTSNAYVHSIIKLYGKSCNNCTEKCPKKHVEFLAKYLFSGCYEMQVKPIKNYVDHHETCTIKPFVLKTSYTKKLIGNSNVTVMESYDEPRKLLSTAINFDVPFGTYPDSALVKLDSGILLEDCTGTGKREACCSTGKDNGDCCTLQYSKEKECACHWKSNTLRCEFKNILPGNYCLNIDLVDPRCDPNTLWANNYSECTWYFPYFVGKSEFYMNSLPIPASEESEFSSWIVYVAVFSVGILLLLILVVVYFKMNHKVIYNQYVSFAPSNKKSVCLITSPKLLLLYPRDCEPFMNVMKEFRSILQEILFAQVFDIWDPKNMDEIYDPQWSYKYLNDKSVKIVLIASPCSKLIEESIINQKPVEYKKMKTEDRVYTSALQFTMHLLNTENERYHRFFIVRLDSKECVHDTLTILSTIYTLPQHLKDIVMDIHNMDPSDVVLNPEKLPRIRQLSTLITQYESYRLSHKNYLSEILELP